MTRQPHHLWYATVTALRAQLDLKPDDLELANRLWELLGGSAGYDVRSGRRVISTYRDSALKSDEGLAALVKAFRKLADETGECPRAALFDPPLENLLRMYGRQADHSLHDDIQWILESIDADN